MCAAPTVKQHKPHSRLKNQEPNKAADCPPDAVPLIATHPLGSAEPLSNKQAPKDPVTKKRKKAQTEKPKNGDNPPAEAQPEVHAAGVSSQKDGGRSRKRRKTAEGLGDTSVRGRQNRAEPLEGGSKLGDVASVPNGRDLPRGIVTTSDGWGDRKHQQKSERARQQKSGIEDGSNGWDGRSSGSTSSGRFCRRRWRSNLRSQELDRQELGAENAARRARRKSLAAMGIKRQCSRK